MKTLIALVLTGLALSARTEDIPLRLPNGSIYQIENPFGFDQRLALIDHIKERFGIQVPAGASEEEAIKILWEALPKESPAPRGQPPSKASDEHRLSPPTADSVDRENIRIQLKGDFGYALEPRTTLAEARVILDELQKKFLESQESNPQGYMQRDEEGEKNRAKRESSQRKSEDLQKEIKKRIEESEKQIKELDERQKNALTRRSFEGNVIGKRKATVIQQVGAPDDSSARVDSDGRVEYLYYWNRTKQAEDSTTLDKSVQVVIEDGICVAVNY